ncbi:MAG: DUF151 domain-containing protein [Chloroflexales bacterium]|nr:DUF151 domain-containing protein [Chloroflexales bacterium]
MKQHDNNQDDATLVLRVLAGEREVFSLLVQRYYTSVLQLCRRLLNPSPEAQDIAQEAALQAFLNLDRLHAPERFGAWLHAIAANLAHSALRRRHTASLDALADESPLAIFQLGSVPSPEEVVATREVHDTIVAALRDLSLVNREAVIGFYLDGYSYVELAELLGVPISTVKGRLFKGRRQLRQVLEPLTHDVLKPDRRLRKERHVSIPDLIEVRVDSIYVESWGHRLAILRTSGSDRILPIWIGPYEADAIQRAMRGEQYTRPLTHDLLLRLLGLLQTQIQRIVLHKIAEEVFGAEIELQHGEQTFRVDARPSDAFVLAVQAEAPLYVARSVFVSDSINPHEEKIGWGYVLDEAVRQQDYSVRTLVELAQAQPQVRMIEVEGQTKVTVCPSSSQEAFGLWVRMSAVSKGMWLLFEPELWEQIQTIAKQRYTMLKHGEAFSDSWDPWSLLQQQTTDEKNNA